MKKNISLLETSLNSINKASKEIRDFVNEIVDDSSFVETSTFLQEKSVLEDNNMLSEGVLTGYASIEGTPLYIIAQNSAVLSGAFGVNQAKKIIRCIDSAISNGHAILSILDSSGAKVGEGVDCLEAFAMVLTKIANAREIIPHIAVAKGNVVGHFAAYLSMADFVFGGSEAVVSFNPPSVQSATVGKQNKELFGCNTHLKSSGLFDFYYNDTSDLKTKISTLLDYTNAQVTDTNDDPNRESTNLADNISTSSLILALADNGKGLQYSEDYGSELRCYFCKVNGIATGIIASDTSVNGYFTPKGLDKVINFVSLLQAYELPLITLIDSKGLMSTLNEEQESAICYVGSVFNVIAEASIPKIGVAVGNAVGLAYTAFLSKGIGFDYTIAFPDALIMPINSDTAVSLVYSEELAQKGNTNELRTKLEALYKKDNGSPFVAASKGYIDNVIHPATLRPYISNALIMLLGL